jgi:hypothetical protein
MEMLMKRKTLLLAALGALVFGAGIGVSSAQVYDWRCQSCEWNFQACLQQCDYEGGEGDCYAGCVQRRRLCVATFCR